MLIGALFAIAQANVTEDVATTWRLVDYMAVDYADAVQDGQVVNPAEYEEMHNFSRDIRTRVEALPDVPESLVTHVDTLEKNVAEKVPADELRANARALGEALLTLYPVPTAPPAPPSIDNGAALFATHCASCHGASGDGKGPASPGMDPPPVDFTDPERARQRSVFALYQVTTQGLEETPMVGFTQLSAQERWDVATYASTLAFPDSAAPLTPEVEAAVPDLTRWASITPAQLASNLPDADTDAAIGHLRRRPQLVEREPNQQLGIARTRLAQSLSAWEQGDIEMAQRHALAAYLDGFEPVEALLAGQPSLLTEVEQGFNRYRSALGSGDPKPALASLHASLDHVERDLQGEGGSSMAIFSAALVLLVREGLEALLVVMAMLGMLRKTGRDALVSRVHAGWIGALAAGGLTWWLATSLITLSGAQRELIEGVGGVVAALVLISVGVWMHDKAIAGRWQAYVHSQVTSAIEAGSGAGIVGLVFVVVYREVFETILFYTSLWAEGGTLPVLGGFLTGVAILGGLAFVLHQASLKLPIGTFFGVSAWLMSALAVILAGKGISGLQAAGLIGITTLPLPALGWVGFNATAEALVAQLLTLMAVAAGVLRSRMVSTATQE